MQEKRGPDQNLSIRSPQAPSTLKVYNCCPHARPAQVGGGAPRAGGGRGRQVFENILKSLSSCAEQSAQCSIELPTRLEHTTIAVNTPLHLERLLDLSKLTTSVNLYLSPSHLQSLGAQLGRLGDGEKSRSQTRFKTA